MSIPTELISLFCTGITWACITGIRSIWSIVRMLTAPHYLYSSNRNMSYCM